MTWVTLQQNRVPLLLWGLVIVALALFVWISGIRAWGDIVTNQLGDCFSNAASPRCAAAFGEFAQNFSRTDRVIFPSLLALPVLLGVFGAAPLTATDLEHLTYRFVWAQAISPRRWLAVKLALMILVASASALVLSAASWPWLELTQLMALGWSRFGEFPLPLFAYFLFASAVGLGAGLLLGRAIPAAITAFAVCVVSRASFELWLRQMLVPPLSKENLLVRVDAKDWFLSLRYYDAAGRELPTSVIQGIHLSSANPAADMAAQGIKTVGYYQPWERFWTLQAIEAAVFAALSLVLIAAMLWWVDRARS